MRYIKLFEGFDDDWNNVKQNIDDMLSAELRDVGLLYSIAYRKQEKSLMSKSGETRIDLIVLKNIDNDDFDDVNDFSNRNVFDLSLAYEPVAFVVDYLKDKYGRRYSGSSRVEGFNVKYTYTTPKPEYGPSKFVELGSYELLNLDKLNVRTHDRKTIIGSSFLIEIKIWD
jgi:hypothetical protein